MISAPRNFVFQTAKGILCEQGASKRVGELIKKSVGLVGQQASVLVVTDRGIQDAHLDIGCIEGIQKQGFNVEVYADVTADPPEKHILDAVHIAREKKVCAVVGLGGGSSMDVAKLVAFLGHSSCQQSLNELYGVGMGLTERLPLLQVPTTAGTGSEVTPISIVTSGENSKKGVVMHQLLPDWAVLDAELTLSVPAQVTAATGVDAMVHAIEAFTSRRKKNPLSDLYACEALRLLGANIRAVCANGSDINARGNMLLGSMYAGMAFANSPVGAVHALAYPIGSMFHVPHGLSNSLMLPHVIEYNSEDKAVRESYKVLTKLAFTDSLSGHGPFSERLQRLTEDLKLPQKLSEVGIRDTDVANLAAEAMKQTRLLPNNPRDLELQDAIDLYKQAL